MNRRSFLRTLATGMATAAAAAVIDPEQLLWVPGRKTFFLPPERRYVGIITDVAEVHRLQREYNRLHDHQNDALRYAVVDRETWTAAGWAKFDRNWNLVTIAGRKVDAREAAQLRLQNYQRNGDRPTPAALALETERILASRIAAGWSAEEV